MTATKVYCYHFATAPPWYEEIWFERKQPLNIQDVEMPENEQ